jgi:hypothetical protein
MDFERYKNTAEYPSKAAYTTTYWYRAGKTVAQRTGNGEIEILDSRVGATHSSDGIELGACAKESVTDTTSFNAAKRLYNDETGRLTNMFKQDLFAELGIVGHPKAEKLYSIAWDRGHSGGLADVESVAWDLLPLIQGDPFTS